MKKSFKRTSLFFLTIIILVCSIFTGCQYDPTAGEMRDMSTKEIVKDMGIGINLGNTFEATSNVTYKTVSRYETMWGSPTVTKEMIEGYAKAGFGVLRIPVAWSNSMKSSENYKINADLIKRIKQVVEWTIGSGMYAIVNIHWDGGWWEEFSTDKEKCMTKYTSIWEQISEAFKDYGDYLMLESLNEEGVWNDLWNRYGTTDEGKEKAYGLLNEINQNFVDIVRESSGNNAKRHLLIAGYATDIDLTCDKLFQMPEDTENRCAVSVHYYTPSTFTILEEPADWGVPQTEWGSVSDKKELAKYMDMMKENFVDKGIPVIIGEYGCTTKNKDIETVNNFLSSVCKEAFDRGMCPVLWDTPGGFYDREKNTFTNKELLKSYTDLWKTEHCLVKV